MTIKKNVIDVLMSQPVRYVNFTFANRMICPLGFFMLAGFVNSGRIRCEVDGSLKDHAEFDPLSDTIKAPDVDFGGQDWADRSTLLHECAHAMLDCIYAGVDMNGKPATMSVLNDETIGYLAGAIYLIASPDKGLGGTKGAPDYEARQIARPKVKALMAKPWTGCDTMDFTTKEVATLQAAIKKHPFYNSSWPITATHNGMRRP